jgi:copper chaperone CopZ
MTAPDKTAVATVTIGGMHCPACSARIVKALKTLPGVQEAEVSLEKREAKVTFVSGKLTPELLQKTVTAEGYTFESAKF